MTTLELVLVAVIATQSVVMLCLDYRTFCARCEIHDEGAHR